MMTLDLTILPEAIEDIVYQYLHQMKFKPVLDELEQVVDDLQQNCGICNCRFFSFHIHGCSNSGCHHTICQRCVNNEIRYEYESYINNPEDYHNMSQEQIQELNEHIFNNIECSDCTYMVVSEDEEDFADEQLWREMYGMPSFGSL